MQSDAAERIATEIYDAIHDNVATKSDLEALRTALKVTVEVKASPRLVRRSLGGRSRMIITRMLLTAYSFRHNSCSGNCYLGTSVSFKARAC
jgi:hypothetical protein